MRVLTWNLKHGRAVPSAGRNLLAEFADAIAGWEWDVALLQEVPPWWPAPLAERARATERHVLTSRNLGLAVRRAIATRWPDVAKSNGGGCNAILVRDAHVYEHRCRRLSVWPERRWVHAVRLKEPSVWVANVHLQAIAAQTLAAGSAVSAWAAPAPAVLGGDFNLRDPRPPAFTSVGGHGVDHILVRGFEPAGGPEMLEHGHLSDHDPLRVSLRPAAPRAT